MYKNRVKVNLETLDRSHHGVKYLITNRVIGGSFIFGEIQKEHFLRLVLKGQYRHSYRLVDYVLMDNHYHCIIEIPPPELMSRDEVFRRWCMTRRENTPIDPGDYILDAYRKKIHDISFVVGNFEQRFVQWYNRHNGRLGSLFNRFDSVIVEDGKALAAMMAYITLNPVRAGMVTDPADYHWCGYTQRLARGTLNEHDINLVKALHTALSLPAQILKLPQKRQLQLLWKYFRLRFMTLKSHHTEGIRTLGEKCLKEGKSLEVDRAQHFMLKVRFATKGIAIGSQVFVEGIMHTCGTVLGYKRVHHAQDYHIWDEIYTLKKHKKIYRTSY